MHPSVSESVSPLLGYCYCRTFLCNFSRQDLSAIDIHKTGHKKKLLSESAKLETTDFFPKEKPVCTAASL